LETKYSNNSQTIIADSEDDCVAQIRKLYGGQFQIINRKIVRKPGIAGFLFGRNAVQLTFRVRENNDPYMRLGTQHSSQVLNKPVQTVQPEDFETAKQKILQENKPATNPQFQIILEEVKNLRDDLNNVKRGAEEDPETIVKIRDVLEENEFSPRFIRSILDKIKKEFSLEELEDYDAVQDAVVDWIGETIHIATPELKTRPHVIALVGPTGVGKTTTVGKLAASFASPASTGIVQRPMNVRMITIDLFRIGARQQIEAYGEIMQIPVDTVGELGVLEEKITRMGTNTDVILIDTIGYSPKDYESIGRMKKILEMRGTGSESFLTIMASTKASDLREIMKQYEIFGYESVIITKLDETDCIGNLLSVLHEKNKSIVFITTGQKVPRDIEKASVLKLLMHLKGFKINRDHIEEKFSVIDNDGDEDGRSSI